MAHMGEYVIVRFPLFDTTKVPAFPAACMLLSDYVMVSLGCILPSTVRVQTKDTDGRMAFHRRTLQEICNEVAFSPGFFIECHSKTFTTIGAALPSLWPKPLEAMEYALARITDALLPVKWLANIFTQSSYRLRCNVLFYMQSVGSAAH